MKNIIGVFGNDAIFRFWVEFALWLVAVFAIFAMSIAIF